MITRSQTIRSPPKYDYISEIKLLLNESQDINIKIQHITNDIVPLEFESYTDYFLINTFKRGKSDSGRVDMLDVKYRDHSKYYQKIGKPNGLLNGADDTISSTSTKSDSNRNSQDTIIAGLNNTSTTSIEATVTPPPSHSSSLEYLHKLNNPIQTSSNNNNINNNGNQTPMDSNSEIVEVDELEDFYDNTSGYNMTINTVDSDIRKENILDTSDVSTDNGSATIDSNSTGYRRRSSRISKKQEQKRLEKIQKQKQLRKQILSNEAPKNLNQSRNSAKNINFQNENTCINYEEGRNGSKSINESIQYQEQSDIKDLYESLVPKVKVPNRRSDWILPPRLKYQPEKQMRTKVVVDSIKVHELIDTDRISKVLSRFEGGVAGIRKTFNIGRPNISSSGKRME
ncbi:Rfm1p PWA37_001658 [Arxiozyma heterogenica]|uniref:Uncharacterized protein n=1 Tax=Arxiozyma heterogenica TaxID=278026 RepID=A0AAN7WT32_9SACH|nr:hypothetical protein RI543_002508 [Kazachstania heterogenica]